MHNVKKINSTKLFYNEYPYKISYKRLYGFPKRELMKQDLVSTLLGTNVNWESQWWFDYPSNDEDLARRTHCKDYIRSLDGTKMMNSSMTHVYFKDKSVFETACKRYRELQQEHHIPLIDNLEEIINGFKTNVDLKKSLYHKKYRYKVTLRFDKHFEEKLGPSLYDMYQSNSNYHLNPNVLRFSPENSMKVPSTLYSGYRYRWRHSAYHVYAIYCREKIDMEMLSFVASENIAKITKAVLINEIDK